jgi:hypothetical protein
VWIKNRARILHPKAGTVARSGHPGYSQIETVRGRRSPSVGLAEKPAASKMAIIASLIARLTYLCGKLLPRCRSGQRNYLSIFTVNNYADVAAYLVSVGPDGPVPVVSEDTDRFKPDEAAPLALPVGYVLGLLFGDFAEAWR